MPPKGGDAALETYIKKFGTDIQQQLEACHKEFGPRDYGPPDRNPLKGFLVRGP